MQIMVKINFKLDVKAITHWISVLYMLWDKYLVELEIEGSQIFDSKILKHVPNLKIKEKENYLLYYLYQISEIC